MQELGAGAAKAGQFFGAVAADNAFNGYQSAATKLLYGDPNKVGPDGQAGTDTGYFGLKGAAALNARPQVEQQLDQLLTETRAGLQTPEQQSQFDNYSRRYRTQISGQIGSHADTQANTWYAKVNTDSVNVAADRVSNDPLNATTVAGAAADATQALLKQAKIDGADVTNPNDPLVKNAVLTARRTILKAQVMAVGATDPARALSILQKNRNIAGADYEPLYNAFDDKANAQVSLGAATNAYQSAKGQAHADYAASPGNPAQPIYQQAAAAIPGGMSPSALARTVQIESGGNATAVNASGHVGLGQFSDATWAQYGAGGDPTKPQDAVAAIQRYAAANANYLTPRLGRPPTDAELYLAHQQGPAGAALLLSHPDAPAASLVGTAAVMANHGDTSMTARQFTTMITNRFNGVAADQKPASSAPVSPALNAGAPSGLHQTPVYSQVSKGIAAGAVNPGDYETIAQKYLGLNEVRDRQTIANFIQKATGQNVDPQTTAWCAAFANAVIAQGGGKGTGSLAARSFLGWGVPTAQPTNGDIVVMSRGDGNPTLGHVGFFMGMDEHDGQQFVKVLAGNQGNSVSVSEFPVSRVLGYRAPQGQGAVAAATGQAPAIAGSQPAAPSAPMSVPAGGIPASPDLVTGAPAPPAPAPLPSSIGSTPPAATPSATAEAAAFKAIQDDPNLTDVQKNLAMEHVRQMASQDAIAANTNAAQRKVVSDQAANTYMTQILTPGADLTGMVGKIAADPNLEWQTKETLTNAMMAHADQSQAAASAAYGPGFFSAMKQVTAPVGDPSRVADVGSILRRAGPGGDLTLAGAQKLVQILSQSARSVDDAAVNTAKTSLLSYAKSKVSFDTSGMPQVPGVAPMRDAQGEMLFNSRFVPKFEASYDQWIKAGKDPWEFLTQQNVDKLAAGLRSPREMAMAKLEAQQGLDTANMVVPPPPQGVDPEGWKAVLALPATAKGQQQPWPTANWQAAVESLAAQPTKTRIAEFDDYFAGSPFTATQLLDAMGVAPHAMSPDERRAGIQRPAAAAVAPAAAEAAPAPPPGYNPILDPRMGLNGLQ